jgi:hypothetical protein
MVSEDKPRCFAWLGLVGGHKALSKLGTGETDGIAQAES